MDCGKVAREEILESYLLNRLSEGDREAFEEHCFECARCFDELQTLKAMQQVLRQEGVEFPAAPTRSPFNWTRTTGLAAAAVLAVAVVLWMRAQEPSFVEEPVRSQRPPQSDAPDRQPPGSLKPTAPQAPSLEQLARVEAPRYEPLTLRDVPDEAAARFQRAMARYREADYQAAAAGLRAAAALDPEAVHVRFFLGVSELMTGQDNAAIEQLRATIALGDSPYLEEAHWYLAKAFLRRKDMAAARAQLTKVVELRGPWSGEAQRMIADLAKLEERSK
jgi:tetratricopeptide (TPR) repeat protein